MQIPDTQIHYPVQGARLYIDIGVHLALIFYLIYLKRKISSLQCNHFFLFFRQSGRSSFTHLKKMILNKIYKYIIINTLSLQSK